MAETSARGMPRGLLEPEEAHLQSESTPGRHSESATRTDEIDALSIEATELERIRTNYRRVTTSRTRSTGVPSREPQTSFDRLAYSISKFWRLQVSVVVNHENCRDHLALERTFLGYLRTSLTLSMLGIIIAQLFRLQHAPNTNPIFGFFTLGKPLSCICQGAAIYTLIVGAFRTWRSQNAIVRGKAITGGIEIILIAVAILAILLMFFVLLIAVDISKENTKPS